MRAWWTARTSELVSLTVRAVDGAVVRRTACIGWLSRHGQPEGTIVDRSLGKVRCVALGDRAVVLCFGGLMSAVMSELLVSRVGHHGRPPRP